VEEVQSLILTRFEDSLGDLWAEQGVRLPAR
jgi:hypothetical protein